MYTPEAVRLETSEGSISRTGSHDFRVSRKGDDGMPTRSSTTIPELRTPDAGQGVRSIIEWSCREPDRWTGCRSKPPKRSGAMISSVECARSRQWIALIALTRTIAACRIPCVRAPSPGRCPCEDHGIHSVLHTVRVTVAGEATAQPPSRIEHRVGLLKQRGSSVRCHDSTFEISNHPTIPDSARDNPGGNLIRLHRHSFCN